MSYGRGPPNIAGMISLKVDNLTYRTTPDDLRRAFDKYGDVGDIYIPRDRFTGESRGFAFVRYADKRDAEDALDAMDGAIMDGRELRVQKARYDRPEEWRGAPQRRSRRYNGYINFPQILGILCREGADIRRNLRNLVTWTSLYSVLDSSGLDETQFGTDHNCLVLINCQYFCTSSSLIYDPKVDRYVFLIIPV
jgi:RNA recognition motif-containing protein